LLASLGFSFARRWFGAFSQWLNGQQLVKPTIPITLAFAVYGARERA
jgi:hypothetical protein